MVTDTVLGYNNIVKTNEIDTGIRETIKGIRVSILAMGLSTVT